MANPLVIVESPAKAKTIGKFLKNYKIMASLGHVRDLPRSQFGVDIEAGFVPKYITVRGKGEVIASLREAAKKASKVFLATDPDREGEAISWHLAQLLQLGEDQPCRIVFHEITQNAVKNALKNARPLDLRLVEAQQARRILDRIVGYQISPLLWERVKGGLSAGRVQSVALRLLCEREEEIKAFKPQEYWTITVRCLPEGGKEILAELAEIGGEKPQLPDAEVAERVARALREQTFTVSEVQRRERKRYPSAPFTTSTLQQEAFRKLGFSAKRTMAVAQQLYEGLEVAGEGSVGLITYMRTDSVHIAPEAVAQARDLIQQKFGADFLPPTPPRYKSRTGAQEAHEAIRPTVVSRLPQELESSLKREQFLLYKLIWERFVASQMAPARYDTVAVALAGGEYLLRATGSLLKFPGFMAIYPPTEAEETGENAEVLASLAPGQRVTPVEVLPKQHFTEPPPAYSEATLVKAMEELGIGRPSTYAPTLATLLERGYAVTEEKKLRPTELGFVVTRLLKEYFPEIVDVKFTANLEDKLDAVATGEQEWRQLLADFYSGFAPALKRAEAEMQTVRMDEESDESCPNCGRKMVVKHGRYGKFLACPGYPECKTTKPLWNTLTVPCPECGGQLVERRSKKGNVFYGCARYPECRFVSWDEPTGEKCPQCGAPLVRKRPRGSKGVYTLCSNQECPSRRKAETATSAAQEKAGTKQSVARGAKKERKG